MKTNARTKNICNTVSDLVSSFLYYDRKEDSTLWVGAIDVAVKNGDITVEEIVAEFESELRKGLS